MDYQIKLVLSQLLKKQEILEAGLSEIGQKVSPTLKLLDHSEVMKIFSIGIRTLAEWRSKGTLPYVKIGGVVRYRISDIQSLLNTNLKSKRHEN